MPGGPHSRRSRYRIEYRAGKWHCVLYGTTDIELDVSPGGTEADAELYMKNHKRYGAWNRS